MRADFQVRSTMELSKVLLDPIKHSFRNKVLAAAGLALTLTAALLTVQSAMRTSEMADQLLYGRGKALGDDAGSQIANTLMLGNTAGAQQALTDLTSKEEVAFAALTNDKKEMIAQTFKNGVPPDLQEKMFDENSQRVVNVEGKSTLQMNIPIMDGSLGMLHLWLNRAVVSGMVASETRRAILTTLLALVVAMLALAWVLNQFVAPIAALTHATRRILEDGDLSQVINSSTDDEIGRLASYFSEMVQRLRQVPVTLGLAASQLSTAVEALEKTLVEQNATVTRQATALQETQVTAEEIKQTSQTAARSAQGILEAAQRADEIGRQGEASVESSMQALGDMRSQVGEIARRINELGDRTRQIGDITATVKELADQSNMLALNAAIEAVRAGEHGKGFSLVAREIRRLADQSIQATNRVREILDSVSSATSAAVKNTETGSSRIEVGLSQAKVSGDNLKALAQMVRDNNAAVGQIASAVNQQNVGVGQVFAAVTDQSKMMDDTVRRLEESLTAVDSLKQVSQSILAVVKSYKV